MMTDGCNLCWEDGVPRMLSAHASGLPAAAAEFEEELISDDKHRVCFTRWASGGWLQVETFYELHLLQHKMFSRNGSH